MELSAGDTQRNGKHNGAEAFEAREALIRVTLGDKLLDAVHKARVLMVGAGGIGCELLKNLVLSGFKNIEVIDLDTIDLSNLNRQFLFHKLHIGQPKAIVARESALRFNPSANIVAIHGNVKDERYGPDYIKNFDIVMNALDNLAARRHVNRLCLATGVPLIESGTAGYLGQGVSECYECQPKPAPRTFATCTIRNNPTEIIHCIVRLFGRKDDQNAVTELEEDEAAIAKKDTAKDVALEAEQAALLAAKQRGFSQWIFHKVFSTDVVRLARMEDLWRGKQPPAPLSVVDLSKYETEQPKESAASDISATATRLSEQRVWGLEENAWNFFSSINELHTRCAKAGELEWSKDDLTSLTFVTAAANLRAHIFRLPISSRFQVKSAAGNIIPAIATTNAVIAGLIVMQAYKLLSKQAETCSNVYLLKQASSGRVLLRAKLQEPNPGCYVCGSHFLTLRVDTQRETVGFLVKKVLMQHLGFAAPNIDAGGTYIEGGDEGLDEEEKEAQKKVHAKLLAQASIAHNKVIVVTDQLQDMEVQISVHHADRDSLGEEFFKIDGKASNLTVNASKRQPVAEEPAAAGKRKRGSSPPAAAGEKKVRSESKGIVMIDD